MGIWDVVDEAQRPMWTLDPHVAVGPLRFGMKPAEPWAALQPDFDGYDGSPPPFGDSPKQASYSMKAGRSARTAVVAYYDHEFALSGIAVDARIGPQILLEDLRLTGRVPSRLEQELAVYTQDRGLDLRYSVEASPAVARLGLLIRVQRVGDGVLTRPVLVSETWSDRCWDSTESSIPSGERRTFC